MQASSPTLMPSLLISLAEMSLHCPANLSSEGQSSAGQSLAGLGAPAVVHTSPPMAGAPSIVAAGEDENEYTL